LAYIKYVMLQTPDDIPQTPVIGMSTLATLAPPIVSNPSFPGIDWSTAPARAAVIAPGKMRQNLSTPVSFANLETRWQSCRKPLHFEADGRGCFVFFITWQVVGFKHPIYHSFDLAVFPLWDGCKKSLKKSPSRNASLC
jgi:hypothetical protein